MAVIYEDPIWFQNHEAWLHWLKKKKFIQKQFQLGFNRYQAVFVMDNRVMKIHLN